jgi:hypothetical protein
MQINYKSYDIKVQNPLNFCNSNEVYFLAKIEIIKVTFSALRFKTYDISLSPIK